MDTKSCRLQLLLLLLLMLAEFSCIEQRTISIPLTKLVSQCGFFGEPMSFHLAQVHIGRPRRAYKLLFEVGFSDSFVYSHGYKCQHSESCIDNQRSFLLEHLSMDFQGQIYEDIMEFNRDTQANSFSLRNNLLAVKEMGNTNILRYPFDGFFSIGSSLKSATNTTNLLVALRDFGLIEELIYSLELEQGQLMLGGFEPGKLDGELSWHKLSGYDSRWIVNMTGLHLGEDHITDCLLIGHKCETQLSTYAGAIYGPRDDIEYIYRALGAVQYKRLYLVHCDKQLDDLQLRITIDQSSYHIPTRSYVKRLPTGSPIFEQQTCYLALFPVMSPWESGGLHWILGANFLEDRYAVFDVAERRLGLGKLKSEQ